MPATPPMNEILSELKTRLRDAYFHALISLEITFDSDYLFCVLNYTVYRG